ncbi:uncharacterized protein BcabD6B2_17690 [Babesia caballi]|uniref:Uncharacterized protein n=1 Tax=Babesia caballi TaxID=5871 RepID=A0AAV4LQU1_BABCB|nr:hypothetical protein BcabD6B2_17690 [Babesia caballi]
MPAVPRPSSSAAWCGEVDGAAGERGWRGLRRVGYSGAGATWRVRNGVRVEHVSAKRPALLPAGGGGQRGPRAELHLRHAGAAVWQEFQRNRHGLRASGIQPGATHCRDRQGRQRGVGAQPRSEVQGRKRAQVQADGEPHTPVGLLAQRGAAAGGVGQPVPARQRERVSGADPGAGRCLAHAQQPPAGAARAPQVVRGALPQVRGEAAAAGEAHAAEAGVERLV